MIRVGTFNTHHGRPRRGFTANRRLERDVARLRADVLALQEVEQRVARSWFVDQPRRLAAAARAVPLYESVRRIGGTGTDGIALLVRGEVERTDVLRLAGRGGRQHRAVLFARAIVAGQAVSVAGTHLQDDADGEALAQLERLLDAFTSWDRPRVLLGDLNLRSEQVAPLVEAAGFALAGGPPSSPAWAPVQRIDHVAADGLAIESVEVAQPDVSDHRPVVVALR